MALKFFASDFAITKILQPEVCQIIHETLSRMMVPFEFSEIGFAFVLPWTLQSQNYLLCKNVKYDREYGNFKCNFAYETTASVRTSRLTRRLRLHIRTTSRNDPRRIVRLVARCAKLSRAVSGRE